VTKPVQNKLWRTFAVTVVAVGLLAIGHRALGPNGYLAFQQRERQKQQLEREIRELTIRNIQLNRDVQQLGNDSKAIEDVARQDLKLAKPGEYIYVLPAETPRPK
jgi:cell division protein FtsB